MTPLFPPSLYMLRSKRRKNEIYSGICRAWRYSSYRRWCQQGRNIFTPRLHIWIPYLNSHLILYRGSHTSLYFTCLLISWSIYVHSMILIWFNIWFFMCIWLNLVDIEKTWPGAWCIRDLPVIDENNPPNGTKVLQDSISMHFLMAEKVFQVS